MYINDEELRVRLKEILLLKTRNQIVNEIKEQGNLMHQYTIDRFLNRKPVSLYSLKKIDYYVSNMIPTN